MTDDNRLKHYTEIEKRQGEEGRHPAVTALHRRPTERGPENKRTEHYIRIERGRET